MFRTCRTCGESLPIERFYRTGTQQSCMACVRSRQRQNVRRHHRRQRREAARQRELQRILAVPVRAVIEYGRPDRCIVWKPVERGFCAFVTADRCPCPAFGEHGTCAHHVKALELLRDGAREERAA